MCSPMDVRPSTTTNGLSAHRAVPKQEGKKVAQRKMLLIHLLILRNGTDNAHKPPNRQLVILINSFNTY